MGADPLVVAGVAVAVVLAVVAYLALSKPKVFLDKTRKSLKIAQIIEVRIFSRPARARARAASPIPPPRTKERPRSCRTTRSCSASSCRRRR